MLDVITTKKSPYLDLCIMPIDEIGDTYIDDFWVYEHQILDTYEVLVGERDTNTANYKRTLSEPLALNELLAQNASIAWSEGLSLEGSTYNAPTLYKAETMTATESLRNNVGVKMVDGVSLIDLLKKGQSFYTSEKVAASGGIINNPKLNKADGIAVGEARHGTVGLNAAEKLLLNDPVYHGIKVYKSGTLNLTESFSRTEISKRQFDESISANETDNRKVSITKTETFSTGDLIYKAGILNTGEKVTFAEKDAKQYKLFENETLLNGSLMRLQVLFDRFIKEIVGAQEGAFKSVYKPIAESLLLKEHEMSKTDKNLFEEVGGSENQSRVVKFKREFAEKISGTELVKKTYTLFEQEADLSIYSCRVLPNPCGVLSDIRVQDHGMTLSEFNSSIERPSGYNVFSEFKVGEYEYQDAMYRLVIRKSNMAANPLVYDYKIHVDIDDVKDRGTAVIPAEETKVYFNRHYYTDPEVVVNVISGTAGEIVIPYITEASGEDDNGRYFKIVLKDATGTTVAGTISWNSNGY